MRKMTKVSLALVFSTIAAGSADARASRSTYDGSWHLLFTTRAGPCDQTYDFTVNIANGVVTEPNLVRFRGNVARNGSVRASVTVQDKFASGSGRLSLASGRGSWTGRSGSAACSGDWTATRN